MVRFINKLYQAEEMIIPFLLILSIDCLSIKEAIHQIIKSEIEPLVNQAAKSIPKNDRPQFLQLIHELETQIMQFNFPSVQKNRFNQLNHPFKDQWIHHSLSTIDQWVTRRLYPWMISKPR